MSSSFRRRIAKIKKILKSRGPAAALFGSSVPTVRSNDTEYPYRQDSNFYYVTGSLQQGLCLLIHSEKPKPILLFEPQSAHSKLWEGPRKNPALLARELGAEIIESTNLRAEIRKILDGVDCLYFQNSRGTLPRTIAEEILHSAAASTIRMPKLFGALDSLLEEPRLIKDRDEIRSIEKACKLSSQALKAALPYVRNGASEWQVAAAIVSHNVQNHAEEAFRTIVAAGAHAATLHYIRSEGRLKDGELVLIDWGTEVGLYGSDVTRVVPVSGKFNALQKTLYTTVLRAQKAAISKVRDGVLIKVVYDAAARELTKGLIELGVLKGALNKLLKAQAFKPYFPHGIGHSVGLDIHDLGPLRGNKKAKLRSGMVFTIEPGLYFSKAAGKLPACGVRIEDTVVVTRSGCRVLTSEIPKEIDAVERMLQRQPKAPSRAKRE